MNIESGKPLSIHTIRLRLSLVYHFQKKNASVLQMFFSKKLRGARQSSFFAIFTSSMKIFAVTKASSKAR